MNPPGAYQKATIDTSDRSVTARYASGGCMSSISTKCLPKCVFSGISLFLVGFLCFSAGYVFAETGSDWNYRATIGAVAFHPCQAMI